MALRIPIPRLLSLGFLLGALLLSAGGCLPDGRPVDGRRLYQGRNIQHPVFLGIENRLWVQFESQTASPAGIRGEAVDVHLVAWDDATHRLLVANKSLRWPDVEDGNGLRYVMRDERLVADAVPPNTPAATLTRVSLAKGVIDSYPDVLSFGLVNGGFYYRKLIHGAAQSELIINDGQGRERSLGPGSGGARSVGAHFYFTRGDDRTLSRIAGFDGPVEDVHTRVTRYELRDDERFALLTTVDNNRTRTAIYDLTAMTDQALPVQNPCCWLGFSGDVYRFAEAASGANPAKLHDFSFAAGTDLVVTFPTGLSDVASFLARPMTSEVYIVDSQSRLGLFHPGPLPEVTLLGITALSPRFTDDGQTLVYVDGESAQPTPDGPLEGNLTVRDMRGLEPDRVISPHGSVVGQAHYFLIPGPMPLVFWGHFGRSASDLFFADPRTGSVRLVAEAISEVSVTATRIVGIIGVSQQDLVGDLLIRDLTSGTDTILAHRVADAAFARVDADGFSDDRVIFTIRERQAAEVDGLWAKVFRHDPLPDAGTSAADARE